jgi:diguanylate cyclase (GGDEF)-like protein
MSRAVSALLHVDHPDPSVRLRARNALVIVESIIVIGVLSVFALAFIPNGMLVSSVAGSATLVFVGAVVLLRSGRVTAGFCVFFAAFLGAFAAVPLLGHDARLSAVYCAMPVAVAGITLNRRGVAAVTAVAVLIAVVGTSIYPPTNPPPKPFEIIVAALLLMAIALTTSLLGLEGQRLETRRADELARSLQSANAELEQRVADRTQQLRLAHDRQEALVAELAELSLRDPLTGLHNRRHADHELPRLLAAADRYDHPLAMAMADLDHFKLVNDDFNYTVGDEVLRRFSGILARQARAADVVTRYGGEEFLVAMPQTAIEQALVLCERVRSEAEAHPWHEIAPGLRVTVSIGVTDSTRSGGLVGLSTDADAALHRAKREGRNRVVAFDGRAQEPPTRADPAPPPESPLTG